MKTRNNLRQHVACLVFALAIFSTLSPQLSTCLAQGTVFTYQGRLSENGSPASGDYDMQFRLYDAPEAGNQISFTLQVGPLSVSNGLFTASLTFGSSAFSGGSRWLEISLRRSGSTNSFTVLTPRQALTPTPYAMFAGNAGNADRLGGGTASTFVARNGDTMTGSLNLPANGLAVGTNQMIISGGSVGIGTATPDAPLTVGSSAVRGIVNIYGGASSLATLSLVDQRPGGHFYTLYAGSSGAGNLDLVDQNNSRTVLTVQYDGNVGIGTPGPFANLDVRGTFGLFGSGLDGSTLQRFMVYADASNGLLFEAPKTSSGQNLPYHFNWRGGGADAMTIHTNGRVGIGTTLPLAKLHVTGDTILDGPLNINGSRFQLQWPVGVNGLAATFSVWANNSSFISGRTSDGYPVGVLLGAGENAWSVLCDRNAKENFEAIDPKEILAKVVALPIANYNLKTQDSSIRHLGPMAQDFYASFHLGSDEKHINTADADGVALAAIQGLNQTVEEQKAALKTKDDRITQLEQRLAAMEKFFQSMVGKGN